MHHVEALVLESIQSAAIAGNAEKTLVLHWLAFDIHQCEMDWPVPPEWLQPLPIGYRAPDIENVAFSFGSNYLVNNCEKSPHSRLPEAIAVYSINIRR